MHMVVPVFIIIHVTWASPCSNDSIMCTTVLMYYCTSPLIGAGDDDVESSISPSPSAINTDGPLLPMEITQTQDTSPTPTPPPEVDGSGSGSTLFFMMCCVVNETNYTLTVTIELGTTQTSIGKIGTLVYYDEIQKEYYDAQLELEQQFPFVLNSDEIILVERITATSNFSLSLLVSPTQEAPSYCMSEDIQIIVTVTVISTPPVCEGPPRIEAYQYDSISTALEELNCHTTVSVPILYRMTTESDVEVYVYEAEFSPIFADYFSVGEHVSSITVCNGLYGGCNDTEISVTLTVNPHKDRLFPFGSNYFNLAIENADDYATSIAVPNGIPFWTEYYSRLYVSQLNHSNFLFISQYPISITYHEF